MADFPTLSSGKTAMYPVVETVQFRTGMVRMLNDTEQRWRKQSPLRDFVLEFQKISRADKETLRTWFNSVKGSFDATWNLTLGSDTWAYCVFTDDEWVERENTPMFYDVSLKIRQTRKN